MSVVVSGIYCVLVVLSACEALEKQLNSLGTRWATICEWTKEKWVTLQDILVKWQQFSEDQAQFSDWLAEKEDVLGRMNQADVSDPGHVIAQVKDLKVSQTDVSDPGHVITQVKVWKMRGEGGCPRQDRPGRHVRPGACPHTNLKEVNIIL